MDRSMIASLTAASLASLLLPELALAQAADPSPPPAGGAAMGEVILATSAAILLTAGLLVLGIGHRTGRIPILGRLAAFSERVSGLPGWVALPAGIAAGALITAFLGFLWDVSLHIDKGRDEGPLANPSHYLILGGLFGIFTAGFFACVLPLERPSRSAIRIVGDWYAPLGGVLLTACASFALIGFPLDDVWHRIFGQDVTLWGPTHLMLIGGAATTLIGIATLMIEGQRARPDARPAREMSYIAWARKVALSGGFLIGLMVFPVEFDFGVPQFRMVFGPILVMFAAGVGLVSVRLWLGRGAAIGACLFYLVIRGAVSVIVGPILGETTPHFALFIVPALVVEAVFLLMPRASTLQLGLWSGIGVGTVGLAAEWGWTNVWMPIPWTSNLLPEGAVLGLLAAMAGSLLGAWVGERLASDSKPRTRGARYGAIAGAVVLTGIVVFSLPKPSLEGVSAQVDLAPAVQEGYVTPTVRFQPADAAEGAEFLNVTAWQGGGFIAEPLESTGEPGTFTTKEPVPVTGDWKTVVRISRGNTLSGIPIYLPEDPAIPAEGVPASPSFERTFVADHTILQREQKDAASWLTTFAYLVVASIALSLIILITWALHRLAVAAEPPQARPVAAEAEDRGGIRPEVTA
ncbi:MAG: hypothetical protein M3383_07475 [Actinomycetota bacterium]|nr:hypothetical protein [Actinomycetota bacterium]